MNTVFLHVGRRRPRFLPLLALLGLVGLVPAARAATESELNSEMKSLAEQIKPFLDSHHETAASIGQFTCPPDLPSSSGPAIASALGAQLKGVGIDVKVRGTKYNIQGDYKYVEDPSANDHSHVLAIEARILDSKTNEELVGLHQMKPATIYNDTLVASLLGITSDLPPDGSAKARDDKIKEAYENPQAHLDHTKIKAGSSPYEIEILVKSGNGYVPRPPVDKDGLAFVELKKDDVYRVRIYNYSNYDAAVTLTIDGLNMFAFSEVKDKEGKPLYDHLIVHAHKASDIPGWYRNNNMNGSDEFLVAKYAECPAAQMFPESASIGTITVSFAAAWAPKDAPPPDEPSSSKSIDLGTKRGAPTGDGYTLVERQYGVTRATVSVRYSK